LSVALWPKRRPCGMEHGWALGEGALRHRCKFHMARLFGMNIGETPCRLRPKRFRHNRWRLAFLAITLFQLIWPGRVRRPRPTIARRMVQLRLIWPNS